MARLNCSALPHYIDTLPGELTLGESGVYPISRWPLPLRTMQSYCRSAISRGTALFSVMDARWMELCVTVISGADHGMRIRIY